MALVDNAWYIDFGDGSTTGYYGVTKWTSGHTAVAGEIIRQLTTPAVNSERCFVCTVAGAVGVTEPTWTVTRGAKNVSSSATYQECTGVAALNGDVTNTPTWAAFHAITTAAVLGQVIKRANSASFWICTTAGTIGSTEPAWANDTAGTTRTDGTATWTCIGVVGNFTGWQAPHARLNPAFASTWGQAGNNFYVASEHAETQANTNNISSPGTLASPCNVLCVAKTHLPPTSADLTTGASISTTVGNSISVGAAASHTYWYGITIAAGSSTNTANVSFINSSNVDSVFDTCTFQLNASAGGNFIFSALTETGGHVVFKNCAFTFTNTNQSMTVSVNTIALVQFIGGSIALTGSIPTTLISSMISLLEFIGVDLSAFGSGKTLVGAAGITTALSIVNIVDCKLGASVTIAAATVSVSLIVNLIRSDSSGVGYRHEKYTYMGSQTVETTIVRTGGASDGTTPISWKIVTNANPAWSWSFESMPIAIWNPTTAANVTVTVCGIWGTGAVPNNDDIWMEVEYLGASGNPQATIATTTKANVLAANSANPSDSSTWGGSTTPFKMVAVLSAPQPQIAGYIIVKIKAAKRSTTFYIDPLVTLT